MARQELQEKLCGWAIRLLNITLPNNTAKGDK